MSLSTVGATSNKGERHQPSKVMVMKGLCVCGKKLNAKGKCPLAPKMWKQGDTRKREELDVD